MAEKARESGSAVDPELLVASQRNLVPAGWQLLYDEQGKAAMVPDEDVTDWELEHGLIKEKYDIDAATQRWLAAYKAFAPTVDNALTEFGQMRYVRSEMAAVLNANMSEFLDAYRWLMRSIHALLPTEDQVADIAHLVDTNNVSELAPKLLARYANALEQLPAARLAEYRTNWQLEEQERQQQSRASAASEDTSLP